jgi:uncharacterized damage-inducible protein DinB
MIQKVPWHGRQFEFSLPVTMFPNVLERLRGTPARLADLLKNVDPTILSRRDGNSWSIQEVIGHLILTDTLLLDRIDDFVQRLDRLRPVDQRSQSNSIPEYNGKEIDSILKEFRKIREQYITRLESLSDDDFIHSSVHPRLNQSMRIVDQMYLAAEHDDHHLVRISELKRIFAEP